MLNEYPFAEPAWYDEEDPDPSSSSSDDEGVPQDKKGTKPSIPTYTGTGYSLTGNNTSSATAAPSIPTSQPPSPAKPDESGDYFSNLQSKGYKLRK
jgi:hypothetical protein